MSTFEKFNNWLKGSVTVRLVVITILILLLLIPVSMVQELIRERKYRQQDAISEVSSKWGEAQTINGLVLTVPYLSYNRVYDDKAKEYRLVSFTRYAYFLPEMLNINGEVSPEKRYRGLYEVIVYNAKVSLAGHFPELTFKQWDVEAKDILWEDATISLGISDLRSIQEEVSINWNGKSLLFNPGVSTFDVLKKGISAAVLLDGGADSTKTTFSMELVFNGSSNLLFTPLGKTTELHMTSTWKDPKFTGAFLPDNREITDNGFTADWKVLHLNRPFPQQFTGTVKGINESAFGVNLYVPVDEYQKSTRSAKYAILFIALTFLIFFFVQIMNRVRIHPIQYIMVGLALCVFYTLLISISEHLSFDWAYLISSVAIIGMITFYTQAMLKSNRLAGTIGGILTVLYVFIYFIIQNTDHALLMGSIGLFLVLAVIMYLTRSIDWYGISKKGGDGSQNEKGDNETQNLDPAPD